MYARKGPRDGWDEEVPLNSAPSDVRDLYVKKIVRDIAGIHDGKSCFVKRQAVPFWKTNLLTASPIP